MSNISKSLKLKKYGSVYNQYIKHNPITHTVQTKTQPLQHKSTTKQKDKTNKTLNSYQKFVKIESRKEKYINMKGSDRMLAISKQWNTLKNKKHKPKK
jgi:hypothetical protein